MTTPSITIRIGSVEDRPRRFAQVLHVRHAHEERFYVGVTEKGVCLKFHETDIIQPAREKCECATTKPSP
jgi:hypothetical protein